MGALLAPERPRRVVVSGASGHLGGWIAAMLANSGCEVRGTSGPGESPREIRDRLIAGGVAAERIEVLPLDLLAEDDLSPLMDGQQALIHVAAPIPLHLPEASPSMLKAAREGTRRILSAAARAGIRRVVATSSIMAAVYRSNPDPDHLFDETDWSSPDTEEMTAYAIAKTEAEREAWRSAEEFGLDLTVINPGILLGPGITGSVSASLNVFQEALAGRATVAPRVLLPVADVRDVARLHVDALFSEAAIGERVFSISEQIWLLDLVEMIRASEPALGSLPVPRPLPDALARKIADSFSMLRYLRYDIGDGRRIAHDKAEHLLAAKWRPLVETVRDTVSYLRGIEAKGSSPVSV